MRESRAEITARRKCGCCCNMIATILSLKTWWPLICFSSHSLPLFGEIEQERRKIQSADNIDTIDILPLVNRGWCEVMTLLLKCCGVERVKGLQDKVYRSLLVWSDLRSRGRRASVWIQLGCQEADKVLVVSCATGSDWLWAWGALRPLCLYLLPATEWTGVWPRRVGHYLWLGGWSWCILWHWFFFPSKQIYRKWLQYSITLAAWFDIFDGMCTVLCILTVCWQ